MARPVVVVGSDDAELLDIACVSTTLDTVTQVVAGLGPGHPDPVPGRTPTARTDAAMNAPAGSSELFHNRQQGRLSASTASRMCRPTQSLLGRTV